MIIALFTILGSAAVLAGAFIIHPGVFLMVLGLGCFRIAATAATGSDS